MRTLRTAQVVGLLVLCAALAPPLRGRGEPIAAPALAVLECPAAALPRLGLVDETLHEARIWRRRAMMAVNDQREAMEAWDPNAAGPPTVNGLTSESWRLQQMAWDRCGYLRKAQAAALRAEKLARSPSEQCRVADHLARIEHELGHHREEFRWARRMAALQPGSPAAMATMQRALTHSGSALTAATSVPRTGPATVYRLLPRHTPGG
jgi:hypothetical protein